MTLERFKSRLKTLNSLRILTIEPNLGFKTSIIKYRDDGCLFGICSFASWVRNSFKSDDVGPMMSVRWCQSVASIGEKSIVKLWLQRLAFWACEKTVFKLVIGIVRTEQIWMLSINLFYPDLKQIIYSRTLLNINNLIQS